MISIENIALYREQFATNRCAYLEPDLFMRIGIEDENGDTHIQPKDETDEIFLDRLERSKAAGRNLFFEEWEKFEFEYDPDCVY